MAKTTQSKFDWDSIRIVIDKDAEPNPLNPYASSSPEDRERGVADVARRILLRRLETIASN